MGQYINPPGMTKEDFLKQHGKPVSRSEAEEHADFETELLVVLVDNGIFTAAGICDIPSEHAAWMQDTSYRPMKYYKVSKEKCLPYL